MAAGVLYISTSFADAYGRTWTIVFDPAMLPRVSQETGVDLTREDASTKLAYDVARDPVRLAAALWVFLADQAAQRGIDRNDFETALNGGVLDAAEVALWAAFIDAMYPRRERAAMRRKLGQIRETCQLRLAAKAERHGDL